MNSTTVRKVPAFDAIQGVAVDSDYFYAINDYSITKHNKTSGRALLQWNGGPYGSIIHLDGGVVIGNTLWAPHSNYDQVPITSSIETWDTETLEHIGSHSFGIYRGSLTWIDRRPEDGVWFGTFANYDRVQPGQTQPYGLTMNTQLVQFNSDWSVNRSFIYPEALWESFSPMSNSGGSFGPDGWLYITGHDATEVYVMNLPSAGSIMTWVATIWTPSIAGQGIAWDRSKEGEGGYGSLYGIYRDEAEVVEMRVPLQRCDWYTPERVGRLHGPGHFIKED